MMEQFLAVYGIKIVAALVVLFALVAWLIRGGRSEVAGGGENPLPSKIAKLGGEYTLLNDVIVPVERGMIRIDHVVVSPFGIFVITHKREAGKVRGRTRDREWGIKSGRDMDTIYNPLWENRKQVNALEKYVGSYPFFGIVVFSRAKLKNDFGENVVTLSRLPGFIRKYEKSVIFSDTREAVIQKLQERKFG